MGGGGPEIIIQNLKQILLKLFIREAMYCAEVNYISNNIKRNLIFTFILKKKKVECKRERERKRAEEEGRHRRKEGKLKKGKKEGRLQCWKTALTT